MLNAAIFTVDFLLCVLPIVFALMIAHDFVLYVQHQLRLAQVAAPPQLVTVEVKAQPKAEPPESTPTQIERQPEPLALPDLSQLKLYKLHGQSVLLVEDLPIPLPANTKAYRLRGKECVRLADLETMTTSAH